jgi:hypothetical protein
VARRSVVCAAVVPSKQVLQLPRLLLCSADRVAQRCELGLGSVRQAALLPQLPAELFAICLRCLYSPPQLLIWRIEHSLPLGKRNLRQLDWMLS